ncbi:hypothetical protein [Virgibacillus sp. DJP39]|uniref:hypothetical protein n=1 Tax=Virgibacillus sp. DJP39 TaxID=3409790 RepID=UPI003BB6BCF2
MRIWEGYIWLALLLITLLAFLSACGDAEAVKKEDQGSTKSVNQSEQKQDIYQNEAFNLKVQHSDGWKLENEVSGDKLIVSFKNNNNVKAIVTSVATEKNFSEIKDELKTGVGNIEIIEDNQKQLSFKSNLENSIRTDIYLEKQDEYTFVYTFMTPNKGYQQVKQYIDGFRKNIKLN